MSPRFARIVLHALLSVLVLGLAPSSLSQEAAGEASGAPAVVVDPPTSGAEPVRVAGAGDVPPVLIPWPLRPADEDDDPLIPLIPSGPLAPRQASPVPAGAPGAPGAGGGAAGAGAVSAQATPPPATTTPSTSEPVTKTPPGTFTETELSVLVPSLRMPNVGARVVVSEMSPPSSDVRRWQFEKVDGLTWESEEAMQEGEWVVLRGKVDVRAGIERIRADEIRLHVTSRQLEADGNVVLDRLDSRLTGRRLEYDTVTNTGVMYDAMGFTADDLSFTSDIAEKVAENKYVLRGATFTSCTQPSPIWQVNASKAVVEIDRFVYLWNPRVRFGKIPLSYFPWIAFPIKQDRTTGFMIPRISSSSRRGMSVSEEFFWAINRSTDLTVGGTWWQKFGWRADAQARWFLPGMNEYGFIEGVFLQANKGQEDPRLESQRYFVGWEHRQRLGQWDLTFTGEVGTDPLVKDFEGLIGNAGTQPGQGISADRSPILNQRLTLQRRWGKGSLNIFLENDERGQVQPPPNLLPGPQPDANDIIKDGSNTTINRSLPLVEWRASGIQLGGKRWAVFDLESSVGSLTRGVEHEYEYPETVSNPRSTDRGIVRVKPELSGHDYYRADLYPQFSFPMGTSFLRVIPEVNVRGTWWSRVEIDSNPTTPYRIDPESREVALPRPIDGIDRTVSAQFTDGIDEDTFLWAWDAGVRFEGPDFERIFNADAEPGQRKWQHLIEPSIEYSYSPEMEPTWVIQGDARRSHYQQRWPTEGLAGELREGGLNEARLRLVNTIRNKRVVPPGSTPDQPRDVVIWSLSSTWDLDKQEQEATFNGRNEESRFSNIQSDFNIRPTDRVHFSLRNTYDVLVDDITQTSLTGGMDWNSGYFDIAYSSQRNRDGLNATSTEVSLTGEHWLYKGGRLRIGYDLTRELDKQQLGTNTALEDATPWIYKRLVVSYYNQCLGLSLSWEDNANRYVVREREWTLIVSLKELGNFLRYRRRSTATASQ